MADRAPRKPAKHVVIAGELREKIYSHALAPGDQVPSEPEIAKRWEVSADTARKVLAELANEGLTEARQGVGTVVRDFMPIRRNATKRLSVEVWGDGVSMWDIDAPDRPRTVEDLSVDEVQPPALVAAALDLEEGATAWRRSRRYCVDGEPVMRAVSYIPADLASGTPIAELDTGAGGIYGRLADVGHGPVDFREEIRVRMPRPQEAEDLALGPGTPVVIIARYAMDAEGRVVETNEMTLSSAKYILEYAFKS
ncbi:GntR family transcriptional regulator [Streptomyces sp. SDr-06]|uniref:GntR family transcriptional regulator n=1 Tax=Streptomyces sp. SDr-06 TaxID=2267702 RepID=UPI000DEB0D02|nr:GntR family transcriptional regulator [Streptomyces sp. SDr-06]RCH70490.1 GntR family transcriptional regulator [Streptomyces sp. SDr-06]